MSFARRFLAVSTAISAVVLGLGLATAGPAAAATGTWNAYGNKNPITSSSSSWTCGTTVTVSVSVLAQTCMVKSPSGDSMQGAVIVRNNRSSIYQANASVSLFRPTGHQVMDDWDCPKTGIGANSWSVCFGKTITYPGSTRAEGSVNYREIPGSPMA
ncbi:hypothetical protein [Amycolatopsis sp. YIM 10]|uniref:hypothetical protein n=1 Tax=Amycolatopsis sp. YIM 10 TaxID=2653857 RepID=UPI0012908AB5|nr:hypothetical protein [Amycolatopsis sp. YIM 10]